MLGQSVPFRVVDKETGEEIPLDNVRWDGDFGNLGGGVKKDVPCNKASETDTDYRKVVAIYRDTKLEGQLLVCDTVIGIHSTVDENTPLGLTTHGHAFISVNDKCYGLYPWWNWKQRPLLAYIRTTNKISEAVHSRYFLLNPSKKQVLQQMVTDENVTYDIIHNNCATWAGNVYKQSTSERVETSEFASKVIIFLIYQLFNESVITIDTPRKCAQSIIALEAKGETAQTMPWENRIFWLK